MKKLFFTFLLLGISNLLLAQDGWKIEFYDNWNHTNFRQNQIFKQTFNTSSPDYLLLDAALFYITNEERAKIGVEPMRYHRLIEVAAYNHSYKMATTDFFSHQNPKDASRKNPEDRGRLAGISNPAFAENIAYNYPGSGNTYMQVAEKLMDQWMNSSGHKANILSKSGRQMGCGTYFYNGKIYGTQAFQWFADVVEDPNGGTDKLPGQKGGNTTPIVVIDNGNNTGGGGTITKPDDAKKPNNGGGNIIINNNGGKIKSGSDNSELFSFKLGAHLNYSMGDIENLPSSFDSRVLSGHGTAMLAYRFGNRSRKKSCFGVFGTYGQYSSEATALLSNAAGNDSQLSFFEIEAGFIFNEWLRLSGGKGFDKLSGQGTTDEKRDYTTATLGFAFGPKNFKVELNNTIMLRQDDNLILWRPSVGLAVKLDFLKK